MFHGTTTRRARIALASLATTLTCALAPGAASAATWHDSYDWPGGHGYYGWSHDAETADAGAYAFGAPLGDRPGLSLWLPGDRWYMPASADWHFEAPGTTRIASASARVAYRDNLFAHHCLELGLRDAAGTRDAKRSCSPPGDDGVEAATLNDATPTSTGAYMRAEFPACHNAGANGCPKWIPSLDPGGNAPLARLESIDMTLVDDDLPAVTAGGALFDAADSYVNGESSYDLTIAASDAGAGVKQVAAGRAGGARLAAADAVCDPGHHTPELGARVCPESTSQSVSVSMQSLPEGSVALDATAADLAGNTGTSAPWNVLVDRTPPFPVSELEMNWDPDANEAVVGWEDEDDPDLADGTPGSGTAFYEYRYRHAGATTWSDWRRAFGSVDVPGAWIGEEIEVGVRATDAVGNVSEPTSELLTVPDPADNTDGEEGDTSEQDDGSDSEDGGATATAADAEPSTITIRFAAGEPMAQTAATTSCSAYPATFFWKKANNGGELRTTRVFSKTGKRITKFDPFTPKLPGCRLGKYGTIDFGRKTGARAGMSAQFHLEKRLDLLPAGYRAGLLDSLGNTIARIHRVKTCGTRTGDLFAIATRGGKKYCNRVSKVKMTIQGYGCILTDTTKRRDWIIFAYDGGKYSMQIRGFVWKNGLTRAVAQAIRNKSLTDLPDAECDNGDKTPQHSAHELQDPNVSGPYFRQAAPPPTSPYSTYSWRKVNGATTADGIEYAYLMVNTSAVSSGGIVRAVIPIENPSHEHASLDQTDFLGYCDPNGAGVVDTKNDIYTVKPRVRWSYGEVQYVGTGKNIEGWVPTSGLLPAPPPPGSPDGTPPTSPVLDDPNISDPDCDAELAAPSDRGTGYGYSD